MKKVKPQQVGLLQFLNLALLLDLAEIAQQFILYEIFSIANAVPKIKLKQERMVVTKPTVVTLITI